MPSNHSSLLVKYLGFKMPHKIGWCISPAGFKNVPSYMPYVLDNGAYSAFKNGVEWDHIAFLGILSRCKKLHKPLWVVVPDVVGDAEGTFVKWSLWYPIISFFGYNCAFAVQDGMEPHNVPKEAVCCFVGGTTKWKLENAHKFKGVSPWFHIGRVNTKKRLLWAEEIGADSVDGTGFFRGDFSQFDAFIKHFFDLRY